VVAEFVPGVKRAAKRDSDVYPDTIDITRTGAKALAFGGGILPGRAACRIETEIAFRRLADLKLEDLEHPRMVAADHRARPRARAGDLLYRRAIFTAGMVLTRPRR